MHKIRFLIDENIPGLVRKSLEKEGFDVLSPKKGSSDIEIAKTAKKQNRIILTLDKDFTNTILFPPSEFNIIQFAIHPPEKQVLLHAIKSLLHSLHPAVIKGLIIVTKDGYIKIET